MWPLVVKTVVQCFGVNGPLECEVAAAAQVVVAINSSAGAEVIEDDMVDICGIDAIWARGARLVLIAQTNTQVADDDVRSFPNAESLISQADAIAWR